MTSHESIYTLSLGVKSVQHNVGHGDSQAAVQITKEGIKGVFNGVLSDFGDRMSSDGMSTLGTISFQQFKPTDLKASYDLFLSAIRIRCHLVSQSPPHPTPPPPPHTHSPTHLLTHSSCPRVWCLHNFY